MRGKILVQFQMVIFERERDEIKKIKKKICSQEYTNSFGSTIGFYLTMPLGASTNPGSTGVIPNHAYKTFLSSTLSYSPCLAQKDCIFQMFFVFFFERIYPWTESLPHFCFFTIPDQTSLPSSLKHRCLNMEKITGSI